MRGDWIVVVVHGHVIIIDLVLLVETECVEKLAVVCVCLCPETVQVQRTSLLQSQIGFFFEKSLDDFLKG